MLFPPDIYGYAELHKAKFQNPNFSVTRGRDRVCLAFIFRQDLSKAYKCISIKLAEQTGFIAKEHLIRFQGVFWISDFRHQMVILFLAITKIKTWL